MKLECLHENFSWRKLGTGAALGAALVAGMAAGAGADNAAQPTTQAATTTQAVSQSDLRSRALVQKAVADCLEALQKAKAGASAKEAQEIQMLIDNIKNDLKTMSQVHVLKIVKAIYGVEGSVNDVTKDVAAMVKDGALLIKVTDENFGDPAPTKPKKMRIDYILDGKPGTKIVGQNTTIRIPDDN